jgi:hypothetical protein
MSKFNVQKVESLPSPLVANTIYFVKPTGGDSIEIFVTNNSPTFVAFPASGSLRTAGDAGIGSVKYNGTTKEEGQFYGGSGSIPISNERLNYDGDFYATSFISSDGVYTLNVDGDSVLHYIRPTADGAAYNVISGKDHIFTVANNDVAKITNEGVISLSGIKTGDPEDSSSAFWRLGRVFDTTPTADKGIRVQIENKYYNILAEYIGEIVV